MSAPVKKCEVTPLEALRRLYDVARKVEADEAQGFDTLLQGEIAVARDVLREHKAMRAAPVVPVAAQPVVPEGWKLVPEEPTYEMFNASAKIDNEMFAGGSSHGADDGQVWAAMYGAAPDAPSLEAQPAGEVVNIPDMNDWDVQMACVKALLSATDGELGCIGSKLLDTYIEDVKRVVSAAMAQGEKHDN